MKILVLDNYDSFTYNLVHIIRALGYSMDIFRNDKIAIEDVKRYDKILLSPGPGIPDEAGIMKQVIREYGPAKSILGVCLGHQGIGEAYGAKLFNIPKVLHGVTSTTEVKDENDYLFKGVSKTFQATHYHSWAIVPETINNELKITAVNNEGLVMALTHSKYDIKGVQFHPESVMTPEGPKMIENWLKN
ncbi:anthranilate synthase component II [Chryseosolibacter indicus]|uniref:Aminodeoxychorismate/anthranilate synthase component II n=1 Tax=Chryseosolibacter indicus TaxID=2782351 RepID=A0ABS5VPA8_9BACT|nr:aminodeoxychorismate/anthranilate synthase component II [Chryseosolibacter indicus]MBT1703258.1 aminodeoxychorismate/anthranilate synthase component II [Chryseosolibacter indicus]